jgi:hypothetical protein
MAGRAQRSSGTQRPPNGPRLQNFAGSISGVTRVGALDDDGDGLGPVGGRSPELRKFA